MKMEVLMKPYSLIVLTAFISAFLLFLVPVNAIPESDIYKFRASASESVSFDAYYTSTAGRILIIKAFHNEADSYYIVFRHNAGDVPPYDDFFIRFECQGDAFPTELHTTDYTSWNEKGLVSIKRDFYSFGNATYSGSTIPVAESWCQIYAADSLVLDGNIGYTTFMVDVVPVLHNIVITLESACGESERASLISLLIGGVYTVLETNMNIVSTLWIVFQIVVVILVVLGIPILILLLIRWAIWRITGHKLFEKSLSG